MFLGKKIVESAAKSKDSNIEKQEPVEEIIVPPQKREEILKKLRKLLQKWRTVKCLNY